MAALEEALYEELVCEAAAGAAMAGVEAAARTSYWRFRPIAVPQPKPRLCWAAAIKAYTFATPGVTNRKMREVIAIAKRWGRVEPDGTLKNDAETYRMLEEEFHLVNDTAARRAEKLAVAEPGQDLDKLARDELPRDYFRDKLSHSHVVFSYFLGFGPRESGVWHMVTVYGYDKFSFCYMDPLGDRDPIKGRRRGGAYHRCQRFSRCDGILDYIAFWKETV